MRPKITGKAQFAGIDSPGLCFIDPPVERKGIFEARPVAGKHGQKKVYKGLELAQTSIRIQLYNDQDWQDWRAFRDFIRLPIKETQDVTVWEILHPELDPIVDWLITAIQNPKPNEQGVWEAAVRIEEYREPEPLAKKPNKSKTPVNAKTPAEEQEDLEAAAHAASLDAARRENEALKAQDAIKGWSP